MKKRQTFKNEEITANKHNFQLFFSVFSRTRFFSVSEKTIEKNSYIFFASLIPLVETATYDCLEPGQQYVNLSTVKSKLLRGKQKLKKILLNAEAEL